MKGSQKTSETCCRCVICLFSLLPAVTGTPSAMVQTLYYFHRCKAPRRSTISKQQGAPAVIFQFQCLAMNELTGQNKFSVDRLRDTLHDHKEEPVTVNLPLHLNVQMGRKTQKFTPDLLLTAFAWMSMQRKTN